MFNKEIKEGTENTVNHNAMLLQVTLAQLFLTENPPVCFMQKHSQQQPQAYPLRHFECGEGRINK